MQAKSTKLIMFNTKTSTANFTVASNVQEYNNLRQHKLFKSDGPRVVVCSPCF